MALYALPRTALAESDADGTNGSNIVANAVITVTDLDGGTVVMYDDADGTGGATSKLTNSKGQKDVYLPSGEYIVSINSINPQRVTVGNPKEITTTGLINSNRKWQTGDIIETTGFTTAGDGGGGKWLATATTGLTANQTPADRGAAELVDGSGRLWVFVGNALFIDQIGGVLDGSTDNIDVINAAVAWSTSTRLNVYVGYGVVAMSGECLVNGGYLSMIGMGQDASTIKLMSGVNNNALQVTGGGYLKISNLTIDQNRDNNTAGHGIRSGGCNALIIDRVTILNAVNYGIGIQAGTSRNVRITNSKIINTGRDGIDVKDYNLNNDCIFIDNLQIENISLDDADDVGIDIRGEVNVNNVSIKASSSCRGVRLRDGGSQGRAGFGNFSNITFDGTDAGTDTTAAMHIESSSGNWNVNNVTVKNASLVMILQSGAASGGTISNVAATGIFGNDCMTISGSDILMQNISVTNTNTSSRVFDVEPTSARIRLSNVNLTDNSGNPISARIQAGASNIEISGGFVTGGTIDNSGTDSVIDVTYL